MTTLTALTTMHSPAEAWQFFLDHWLVLLLFPVVGGFIGWITKVLAIWMVFKPIEFVGIGPIGWQGQLPRRAAKFGSHAASIVLGDVLDPRDLVDRLDPQRVVAELDQVLVETVDDVARDILGNRWDTLPVAARNLVLARARARAPQMVANLLQFTKDNVDEMFDPTFIVTQTLIEDKELLNGFVRGPMKPAMDFMKKFGLLFGFSVGLLQMVVFAFTESHLLIPVFGAIVGFASDWIALKMLLGPLQPKRYLGVFRWYGLAYQIREDVVRDLAAFAARDILTPQVVLGALLNGPLMDRLFGAIHKEIHAAIDAELGPAQQLVPAAIGSARFNALRATVVARARDHLPDAAVGIEGYAAEALDIENTISTTLSALSNEEFESLLRPIFKDDEWLVVAIGGGLGFAVAEVQVQLLSWLGGI